MIRECGKISRTIRVIVGATIFACCSTASGAADTVTGVVRNQTNGQPVAGDEVILLGAGPDAHEEARVKSDSQGAFTFELHESGKPHLVRVIHQGVNYDWRLWKNHTISAYVFDAAVDVQSIHGGIEIIRAGTQGNQLHVSEMVEIRNDSNPPMTEASERTFEVDLPAHAKIDSVLAAGPDDIGVTISATPVDKKPGLYTVAFPLRPGSTKFAFNYDLPYDGRAIFHTRNMYPLQQLAVMLPPTMTFISRSADFQILPVGNSRYQVEAAELVKAGDGPEFEISGVGELPSMQAQVHSPARAPAASPVAPSISTGFNAKVQPQGAQALQPALIAPPPTLSPQMKWGTAGASAVVILAVSATIIWRTQRHLRTPVTTAVQGTEHAERTTASFVEALKDGLFQLETDRVQGSIQEEEYASAKRALEGTIQWALTRAAARIETARGGLSPDVSHTSTA